jgi:hypothetical protein
LLRDTVPFNLTSGSTSVNGISDGIINLIVENKYPIEALVSVIVYDANGNVVDTLIGGKMINAATTDNNCRVQMPTKTVVQEYVNNARINKLSQGTTAIIIADFSTTANNATCNGQHFKIYSDYTIGLTLAAKFNYKVNTKF